MLFEGKNYNSFQNIFLEIEEKQKFVTTLFETKIFLSWKTFSFYKIAPEAHLRFGSMLIILRLLTDIRQYYRFLNFTVLGEQKNLRYDLVCLEVTINNPNRIIRFRL